MSRDCPPPRPSTAHSRIPRSILAGFLLCVISLAPPDARADGLQLVESWPLETDLDNPDIPDAHEIWLEMIAGARQSLDFAQFYASNQPGSRLEAVVLAVEAAADRGVRVRFLAEEKFYKTYPETLERLDARDGIELRRFDVGALLGGVLHAKYFIVDGHQAFLGSQNFDWRALEHIQELGVRIDEPRLADALLAEFEGDWARAADSAVEPVAPRRRWSVDEFVDVGNGTRARPAVSPQSWVTSGETWDLPQIIGLIDGARERVRVQLLSYRVVGYDKRYWGELESALRDAAARGAQVELILADWSKRRGTIEGLQSLQCIPGISVKLITIPPWSGGFIPFARVCHAKYMVVDGSRAWIGTSNWERSYFYTGRNVGLVVHGEEFAGQLDRFFERNWDSRYCEMIDPGAEYTPPRVAE